MDMEKMKVEADCELDHYEFGMDRDIVGADVEWVVSENKQFIQLRKSLVCLENSSNERHQMRFVVYFQKNGELYCSEHEGAFTSPPAANDCSVLLRQ